MASKMAYIARCSKCNGMVAAMMDDPNHKQDTAKEVAKCLRAGYVIGRVTNKAVREHRWCNCNKKK